MQSAALRLKKPENGVQALEIINNYDAGVIITHEPLSITKFVKPFTILKTKHIVVGLGARKESTVDSIIEAVDTALEKRACATGEVLTVSPQSTSKRTQKPWWMPWSSWVHRLSF